MRWGKFEIFVEQTVESRDEREFSRLTNFQFYFRYKTEIENPKKKKDFKTLPTQKRESHLKGKQMGKVSKFPRNCRWNRAKLEAKWQNQKIKLKLWVRKIVINSLQFHCDPFSRSYKLSKFSISSTIILRIHNLRLFDLSFSGLTLSHPQKSSYDTKGHNNATKFDRLSSKLSQRKKIKKVFSHSRSDSPSFVVMSYQIEL